MMLEKRARRIAQRESDRVLERAEGELNDQRLARRMQSRELHRGAVAERGRRVEALQRPEALTFSKADNIKTQRINMRASLEAENLW